MTIASLPNGQYLLQAVKRRFEAQSLGILQRGEKLSNEDYQTMKQPETQ